MSSNLEAKIRSLAQIPHGEVDDTRFEKLYDDLAEKIGSQEEREILFENGLLSALQQGLKHEDERNRALSAKLLGSLVVGFLSEPVPNRQVILDIKNTVVIYMRIWASDPENLTLVELESISFLLKLWLPILDLNEEFIAQISMLIGLSLRSSSHFVRSASVEALQALCMRHRFEPSSGSMAVPGSISSIINREVALLVTQTPILPGNYTIFAVIEAISCSPLNFMLRGHPVIEFVWDSICCDSDSILSETARCCLRSMIENHAELLLPSDALGTFESLQERLEWSIERILQLNSRNSRNSVINCIGLFEVRNAASCDENAEIGSNESSLPVAAQFRHWAFSNLLSVISHVQSEIPLDPLLSNSASALRRLLDRHCSSHSTKLLAADVILSILLRSSLDASQWRNTLLSLTQLVLGLAVPARIGENTPATAWTVISKFCKLIDTDIDLWHDPSISSTLMNTISSLLACFKAPTPTKVAIIKAASRLIFASLLVQPASSTRLPSYSSTHMDYTVRMGIRCGSEDHLTPTVDWCLFDALKEPLQRHFRFSQEWELRDCMVQLLGTIASQCPDLMGIQRRQTYIFAPLVSGLLDANEHVRASSWHLIACSVAHSREFQTHPSQQADFFQNFKSLQPGLLFNTFCTADAQSLSRVTQSFLMSTLLHFSDIAAELESIADFVPQFIRTMKSFLEDDEWDVRVSTVQILAAIIRMELPKRRERWSTWNCDFWLQSLLNDESREVKEQSWSFFKSKRPLISELSTFEAPGEEEVANLLSSLSIESHYHSDDEVYPLGGGVDANDLDCPY